MQRIMRESAEAARFAPDPDADPSARQTGVENDAAPVGTAFVGARNEVFFNQQNLQAPTKM